MTMIDGLFIDGVWQAGHGAVLEVTNPATATPIARVSGGDAAAIDAAARAAKRAFPAWKRVPARQRGEILRAIARAVEEDRERLVALQMQCNGKPRFEAELDVGDVIATFDYYADCCATGTGLSANPVALPDDAFSASVRFEPVGPVGLIVPWNFPMVTSAWKLAPALAAGCTVVLKPSELTPLTEIELVRLAERAGLPAGVLNLVCGAGAEVGAALVAHPAIAKLSFTGSNKVGQAVMVAAAERVARVSLELGGKSALIVLDDADLDQAVSLALGGAFFNAGQMCSATSRILVARAVYPDFVERFCEAAAALRLGAPGEEGAEMGPLISRAQQRRVLGYIEQGLAEGGLLLCDGRAAAEGEGFFVGPTVFSDLPVGRTLWREEIFGPVACVRSFGDDAEAVAIANDSDFGLVATLVGGDAARTEHLAGELEVGLVWINSPQVIFPQTAWGGFKQSGIGRELGPWGLRAFQEIKHVVAGTVN
ncbi:aldehyde dehydrogenase family protein [Crenobacter sp. SG2305]|uniref:aldehyde dehydrogenase family protein n=1 Tax=Crenobacter oryzisoli TaxID=3056844 RepID=UPI0025AAEE23|nr:aldehyde dehydrogenase family protein [Crenobacter sp. SG2305]MDN0084533.1 aldehyde dehydrogenase family protein [Crenobacter sp. SG2305]